MELFAGIIHAAAGNGTSGFFSKYGIYFCILLAVIVVVLIALLIIIKRKNSHSLPLSDAVSFEGLGNNRSAKVYFNTSEHSAANTLCLAYVAIDMPRYNRIYNAERLKDMQKRQEELISSSFDGTDYVAKSGDNAYIIGISCENGLLAQQRINKFADSLNQKEAEYYKKQITPFHAGICLANEDTNNFNKLIHNAVLAFNHACENNMTVYVCTRELISSEAYRQSLREKLTSAIDNNEFEMFLQFIFNAEKGKFTCAEVLSRWNNPTEGFLMPAYYINDMRTTGVITKFDMYMLDKTCRQLEEWKEGPFADLRLSCNITRVTISAPDFAHEFQNIVKKYKFDHSRLMLEITEDALIDKEIAVKNIVTCKNEGIGIAIDDLCAGHSTLEDISDYPIDQVKLDRNVVVNSSTERGNTLLKELISMAHQLNLEVVCEGVETEEQLNTVGNDGCDFVQGYYYSYVFPLSEAKDYYLKSFDKKD